jgi:hypothetical protein
MHYMKYERSDAPTIRLPAWLRRCFLLCCHPRHKKGKHSSVYEEIPMKELHKKNL